MANVVLKIEKQPETEEYKVVYRINGKLNEPSSYYTDDIMDARLTMSSMLQEAEQKGHRVSIAGRFQLLSIEDFRRQG